MFASNVFDWISSNNNREKDNRLGQVIIDVDQVIHLLFNNVSIWCIFAHNLNVSHLYIYTLVYNIYTCFNIIYKKTNNDFMYNMN